MSQAAPSILDSLRSDVARMARTLAALDHDESVAVRLQGWLSDCERRLSPKTLTIYRHAVGRLAAHCDLSGPTVSQEACERALLSGGSLNAIGGAMRTALTAAGLPGSAPRPSLWRHRPDANAFSPQGYQEAVAMLLGGLEAALYRSRRSRKRDHCPAYLSTALCALLVGLTGVRSGEAVTARREDVRGERMRVRGKAGWRQIPVSSQVSRLLNLCQQGEWLFPGRAGSSKGHIGVSSLDHYCRRLRLSADVGCEALRPLALRHAYASWLVEHGIPITTVQALMGHASPQTTLRFYARPSLPAQLAAAQEIADRLAPVLPAVFPRHTPPVETVAPLGGGAVGAGRGRAARAGESRVAWPRAAGGGHG